MDYKFFVRNALDLDRTLLDPVIELVNEIGMPTGSIARFSYDVAGLTSGQNVELDARVLALAASMVGKIPELGTSEFISYYTVNWMKAVDGYIKEHTDLVNGYGFDDMWTHKVHVPLTTNDGARISFRRNYTDRADWFNLTVGSAWLFNNQVLHSVVNKGESARAHLILYARDKPMMKYYEKTVLRKMSVEAKKRKGLMDPKQL